MTCEACRDQVKAALEHQAGSETTFRAPFFCAFYALRQKVLKARSPDPQWVVAWKVGARKITSGLKSLFVCVRVSVTIWNAAFFFFAKLLK